MEPATRVFCKLRVLLLIDGTLDRFGAWVTNLSETGFFAETPARAPIGTGIRFSLYLADDQPPLPGHASIVWIQNSEAGEEEGIGVKFAPLPPHERQRLMQFLASQFDATPPAPVGLTNPAFRQQVEAEAVSALIAELSQPPVIEPPHEPDDTPGQLEGESNDDSNPYTEGAGEAPNETRENDERVAEPEEEEEEQESTPSPEEQDEEAQPDSPEAPPWPYRSGELPAGLKDLIVIHSTLNQTSVSQLEINENGELIRHHSTSMKDLFVNAYWRTRGLEGRALALNAILPDELLPATPDPVEDQDEWVNTAEEWATLIYEACSSPAGILLVGGSPAFGELFESLSEAFSSADLPVPVTITTGVSLTEALDRLEQSYAPILTLEACGEDLWATQIDEAGQLKTWSIPAACQRSPADTLREAILYCGRLPRTLIAPQALSALLPSDVPIEAVPYAPQRYLELTQIGALRLALGAASE